MGSLTSNRSVLGTLSHPAAWESLGALFAGVCNPVSGSAIEVPWERMQPFVARFLEIRPRWGAAVDRWREAVPDPERLTFLFAELWEVLDDQDLLTAESNVMEQSCVLFLADLSAELREPMVGQQVFVQPSTADFLKKNVCLAVSYLNSLRGWLGDPELSASLPKGYQVLTYQLQELLEAVAVMPAAYRGFFYFGVCVLGQWHPESLTNFLETFNLTRETGFRLIPFEDDPTGVGRLLVSPQETWREIYRATHGLCQDLAIGVFDQDILVASHRPVLADLSSALGVVLQSFPELRGAVEVLQRFARSQSQGGVLIPLPHLRAAGAAVRDRFAGRLGPAWCRALNQALEEGSGAGVWPAECPKPSEIQRAYRSFPESLQNDLERAAGKNKERSGAFREADVDKSPLLLRAAAKTVMEEIFQKGGAALIILRPLFDWLATTPQGYFNSILVAWRRDPSLRMYGSVVTMRGLLQVVNVACSTHYTLELAGVRPHRVVCLRVRPPDSPEDVQNRNRFQTIVPDPALRKVIFEASGLGETELLRQENLPVALARALATLSLPSVEAGDESKRLGACAAILELFQEPDPLLPTAAFFRARLVAQGMSRNSLVGLLSRIKLHLGIDYRYSVRKGVVRVSPLEREVPPQDEPLMAIEETVATGYSIGVPITAPSMAFTVGDITVSADALGEGGRRFIQGPGTEMVQAEDAQERDETAQLPLPPGSPAPSLGSTTYVHGQQVAVAGCGVGTVLSIETITASSGTGIFLRVKVPRTPKLVPINSPNIRSLESEEGVAGAYRELDQPVPKLRLPEEGVAEWKTRMARRWQSARNLKEVAALVRDLSAWYQEARKRGKGVDVRVKEILQGVARHLIDEVVAVSGKEAASVRGEIETALGRSVGL